MSSFTDDKSAIVIPFILEQLARYRGSSDGDRPFFIGLNGVQGAGKTTLVTALKQTLSSSPHNLPTLALSIDDLYLTRSAQVHLASSNPRNPLVQHRGQPSTHDIELGLWTFHQLAAGKDNIKVPSYDKSMHNGRGDRRAQDSWEVVNDPAEPEKQIKVVLFEGWCVGFRPLMSEELKQKWSSATKASPNRRNEGRLRYQRFEDIEYLNDALGGYDEMTDHLDAFVHIDAEDTHFVYEWRLEQEASLRQQTGKGMTDDEVIEFVNGYYPSYELFVDRLRQGVFSDEPGKQLRLVVGRDRKLKQSIVL